MTPEEFEFWQAAYLASLVGLVNNANASELVIAGWAKTQADECLAVWREKKATAI